MKDASTIVPFSKRFPQISKAAAIAGVLVVFALILATPLRAQARQAASYITAKEAVSHSAAAMKQTSAAGKQWTAKQAAGGAAASRAVNLKTPNLRTTPTLYLMGYAHLDTQWRWEYPQVISEYLPSTMQKNFALFQKYPHYIFNWTGANRYMMMKEYFPADFAKLKHYVADGPVVSRGFVNGRKRREFAVAGIDHSPGALRQRIFPPRIRKSERRIHAAGLFRISGGLAEHPGGCRRERIFDAETYVGFVGVRWAGRTLPRTLPSARRSTLACGLGPTATA